MSVTFPGGWPNRIQRDDLGPDRTDDGAVTEHEKARAAECDNLADWQLAGANLCVFRWWAVLHWDGTTLNVEDADEAWDPKAQSVPSAVRTSTGRYRLEYETSYNDRNGNSVATALVAVGAIVPQDKTTGYVVRGQVESNLRQVSIEIDDLGATEQDVRVFIGGM